MNTPRMRYRRYVAIGIGFVLGVGIAIVVTQGHDISRTVSRADWTFAGVVMAVTGVALFFQCFAFVIVNRIMDIDTGFGNLFGIGFVSITIGNVVSAPFGSTEHSIRGALIVPQGYRLGDVIAASLVHSYIKDTAILILAPAVMFYQMATERLTPTVFQILTVVVALSTTVLVVLSAMFISDRLRGWLLRLFRWAWHLIIRKESRKQLNDFDLAIRAFKANLVRRPRQGLILLGFMMGDWISTLVAFELSFIAFGVTLAFTVLVSGFIIGKTAAILSFIPGGIGVRSVTTAGAISLFGIVFGTAILGVVLFRILYDFTPFFISFGLIRFLLRRIQR